MLAAVPMFAHLDHDRLQRLTSRSALRRVAAGTVVALRGQPALRLIVVESGTLTALYDTPGGRRLRLGEYAGPRAVDKAAVLDGRGYGATWLASTPARVRLVPAADLVALVDDVPSVRHHVLAHLAAELRQRQEEVALASFGDTAARVAAWLLRAAGRGIEHRGEEAPNLPPGVRVVLPGAQEGLAEAVGATRVSVNRALRRLARDGLVRVEPGAVVVLATEALAARARLR